MHITINNQSLNFTLETEKTLADLLGSFQKSFEENKAALIGLSIDNMQLSPNDLEAFMEKNLDEIESLALETVLLSDIKEVLKSFIEQLESLSLQFEDIGFLYQSNKNMEVSQIITHFAEFFNTFSQTISLLSLFPLFFNKAKIEDQNILEYLNNFSKILIEFEEALKNGDRVLVGDLAEYELSPVLKSFASFCKSI